MCEDWIIRIDIRMSLPTSNKDEAHQIAEEKVEKLLLNSDFLQEGKPYSVDIKRA